MFPFHFSLEHLESFIHLSYGGIFLAIISAGHLIPVPESVMLILLGYLGALGKFSVWKIIATSIFTTIVIDLFLYAITLGGSEFATHVSKKIKVSLVNRYRTAEERHLFGLVFASHFVPGWRFANPFIAGITQMPWKKFTLYTVISSLIYAPIFVSAGFLFHDRIVPLIVAIESVRQILFWLVIVLVAAGAAIVYNKHHAEE